MHARPSSQALRPLLSSSLLAGLLACGPEQAKPGALSAQASAKPSPSAPTSVSAAGPPTPSGSASPGASASAAAPSPASFGPEITKAAVEAVNSNGAYESNPPVQAVDGKLGTSWSAAHSPSLYLEVGLYPGTKVDGIELAGQRTTKNGKGKEHWDADGVMKRVRVTWDGGQGELTFSRDKDRGVRKRLAIGATPRFLRLEFLEVEKGEETSDVDVDELSIFGAAPQPKAADKQAYTGLCKTEDLLLRFKEGSLFGGQPVKKLLPGEPPKDDEAPILFLPTPARVDDGEWHRLGVKYQEISERLEDGQKTIKSQALVPGQASQYRVTEGGAVVETRLGPTGKVLTGKCGPK